MSEKRVKEIEKRDETLDFMSMSIFYVVALLFIFLIVAPLTKYPIGGMPFPTIILLFLIGFLYLSRRYYLKKRVEI